MLTKQKVKEQIDLFPEEFSLDELVEKLVFIDKVERAERQSDNDEVLSQEMLDKEIEKSFR